MFARSRTRHLHVPLIGALLTIPSLAVAADGTDDLYWGEDLDVRKLSVTVDGETMVMQGFRFPKDAHSYDLKISLGSLGIPSPQLIVATGQIAGNQIQWSFDENVSIELDGSNEITRIHGFIKANVTRDSSFFHLLCELAGTCRRNVTLSLADSDIVVEGNGVLGFDWTRHGAVNAFSARAGLPTPGISGMIGPSYVYAAENKWGAPEPTYVGRMIFLDGISPSTGTTIQIDASIAPGYGMRIPSTVYIPPGQSSALLYGVGDADFRGTFQVVATSETNQRVADLSIRPRVDKAVKPWGDVKQLVPWWELLLACIECFELFEWSDALGPVLSVDDTYVLLQGNEDPYVLDGELTGAELHDVGPRGWLTGLNEHDVPFVARYWAGEVHAFTLLEMGEGSFVPDRVDGQGVVAGRWIEPNGGSYAVLWPSGSPWAIDLAIPVESSMVHAMSDAGYLAGSGPGGKAFVTRTVDLSSTVVSPPQDALAVVLDAVDGHGVAAGHVDYGDTLRAAYLPTEGELVVLFAPEVTPTSWAAGITDAGDVLVNGVDAEMSRAFVWSTETGELTDLDELLPAGSNLHVAEVVQVLPMGMLVFRAVDPDGLEGIYTAELYR